MASTGQPTCLVISDFDAGVGAFANTANTVNTQVRAWAVRQVAAGARQLL
jgi:hypothetical protein